MVNRMCVARVVARQCGFEMMGLSALQSEGLVRGVYISSLPINRIPFARELRLMIDSMMAHLTRAGHAVSGMPSSADDFRRQFRPRLGKRLGIHDVGIHVEQVLRRADCGMEHVRLSAARLLNVGRLHFSHRQGNPAGRSLSIVPARNLGIARWPVTDVGANSTLGHDYLANSFPSAPVRYGYAADERTVSIAAASYAGPRGTLTGPRCPMSSPAFLR
jgi:hypothetical protein